MKESRLPIGKPPIPTTINPYKKPYLSRSPYNSDPKAIIVFVHVGEVTWYHIVGSTSLTLNTYNQVVGTEMLNCGWITLTPMSKKEKLRLLTTIIEPDHEDNELREREDGKGHAHSSIQ